QISILYDFIFFGLLMGSVFLHELGHAWGCLIQGVPVRCIKLNGIGGACERNQSVTCYEHELIVAMGPIVNLAIWAVASLIAPYVPAGNISWTLEILAYVNLLLALFNLVPVMPLDGGKLFQLLLVRFMAPQTATRICSRVGPVSAIICIPLILFA
ncbi:MAG: site-2 protease family protein, partial [Paracoccaceae bacterium]